MSFIRRKRKHKDLFECFKNREEQKSLKDNESNNPKSIRKTMFRSNEV